MIIFQYKGNEYKYPSGWHSIPLSKAIKVMAIEIPQCLEEMWRADESEQLKLIEAADKEGYFESIIPEYFGKVIQELTTIPQLDIDLMSIEDRTEFFNTFLKRFVADLYVGYSDEHKLTSFKWGKVELDEFGFYKSIEEKDEYIMVESLSKLGVEIPFAKETAVSFTESSDLRSAIKKFSDGGQFHFAANIVSILCRKKDEKYNKTLMRLRAGEFKDIPMNIVFSVFFYTIVSCNLLKAVTDTCLEKAKTKVKQVLVGMIRYQVRQQISL